MHFHIKDQIGRVMTNAASANSARIQRTAIRLARHPFYKLEQRRLPSYRYLKDLMRRYTTDQLVTSSPETFELAIRSFLSLRNADMEGYRDASKQRDLSIRFWWGHDHDFGTFRLTGQMGDRHIRLLAQFIDHFTALPLSLKGKRVLDIGCWTGGASLLLHAMGADVIAIEEVRKYAQALEYLKETFDLDRLQVLHASLYDLPDLGFDGQFDIVLFAGVLYHVTDPILALRIVFNTLRDKGICLLETYSTNRFRSVLLYAGPGRLGSIGRKDFALTGWNWFVPSPSALRDMMIDAGFRDIRLKTRPLFRRTLAVGQRMAYTDILRAGLSRRSIL